MSRRYNIHPFASQLKLPSLPLGIYAQTDNVAGGTKDGKKSGFLRAAAATAATATAELVSQGDQ